jgi:hypothetical protein
MPPSVLCSLEGERQSFGHSETPGYTTVYIIEDSTQYLTVLHIFSGHVKRIVGC